MYATKTISAIALLAICFVTCGGAIAQEDIADSSSNASVPLVSGGVGEDEMNYLKSVEHQYNLKVIFTETSGVFLSDLSVDILNKKGDTVVSTVTKGPVLLVDLPSGSYTLAVSHDGQDKREKVSVAGHSLHTLQVRFQGSDEKLDN